MKRRLDLPRQHPSIDETSVQSVAFDDGKCMGIKVKCPNCKEDRWRRLTAIRRELKHPGFSGRCKSCHSKRQTMPRNPNIDDHPAIDKSSITTKKIYTSTTMAAKVTCPHCKSTRWMGLSILRREMKRRNFTGQCQPCSHRLVKAGFFRYTKKLRETNEGRRSVNSQGYIVLGSTFVSDENLPMFRAMQNKSATVFEHRFVMAKHLGRALNSYECIDHKNGIKDDNRIENLRIYLRGKQQPGSCPGYGTYYHEWQMAEAELKKLKAKLSEAA